MSKEKGRNMASQLDELIYNRQIENYRELEDVLREGETGELTLSIARMLYMENPDAYIGMFDGNRQARMKRETLERERLEFERWAKKHVVPGFREHYGHLEESEQMAKLWELFKGE